MQTFFVGTGAAVFEWRLASSAPAGEGAGGPASGASMFPRVPQWMAGTGAAIFGPRYLRPADVLGGGGLPSGDSLFPRMPQWVAGTAGAIFGPRYLSSAVTPPVYNPAGSLGAFGGGGGGKELRELIDRIKKDAETLYADLASPKLKPKSPAAKPVEKNLLPQLNALEARVKSLQSELKALQHEKAVLAQLDADAEEEAVATMLLL